MKNNIFFGIAIIAVLAILFIFNATQLPANHMKAGKLPVAVLVEDQNPMAIQFADKLTSQGDKFDWVIVDSEAQLNKKLQDRDVYGAIVIPENYSKQFASLQSPKPQQVELQFLVNQGKNTQVAAQLTQGFNAMGAQLNKVMSEQLFTVVEQKKVPLNAELAKVFANPLKVDVKNVHEVGSLSTAPFSFFQPIWMASLIGAVMLWFAGKTRVFQSLTERLSFRSIQLVASVVIDLIAGYAMTWYSTWMLDYDYASFNQVALFLSISSMAFILLILAFLSWLGMAALPIFVLLMFFGLPLLQLAPEMLPSFYADWIMPWLPFQFLFDGLREVLFYDGSVWNSNSVVLVWIAVISAIVILLKGSAKEKAEK